MDPNTALREFRMAMARAREAGQTDDDSEAEYAALQDAVRYAEALDEWMSKSGALPSEWTRGRNERYISTHLPDRD
jgi:hypothetical protein